jgi:hypothetical protein
MTTIEKQTVRVSTDCLCENEDGTPQEYCYGDCYEWQKEDVFALLGEWQVLNSIDEDDPILVNGSGLTWQRLEGYKWTTMLELDGALSLNGDFTIEWYLEDTTLTAKRWSHDEPTGTGLFHFTVHKGCDKCGEPVAKEIHAEELGMCIECSNAYFDHEDED